MLSVLLDTHILIWWRLNHRRLSAARNRILQGLEKRGEPAAVSAITLWELAKMAELGRLEVDAPLEEWLGSVENDPMISVLPLTARIAAESVRLGAGFLKDPADQLIVATARCHGLRLMTADERIRRWGKVPLV